MQSSVVVDFDGTLVKENSSRILEKMLLSSYRGPRRSLIRWTFFERGQTLVRAATGLLRRVTHRDIDWRIKLFLRALGPTSVPASEVIERVASELTLNTELVDSLVDLENVTVISCGIATVIERFCSNKTPHITLLAASAVSTTPKGAWRAELLAPRDKIPYLVTHCSRRYITDDNHEAHIVASAFTKADGRTFSVHRVRELFEVVADEI